ncbi:MAG TPA: DoxX family protein [Anaerolineae bacterium]|nr:DoxX family protein [Anaerolineae bacterium]
MFGFFEKNQKYVPLILRIIVGVIFLLHGLAKFGVIGDGNIQGVIGMFGQLGMPVPGLTAPFVALVESVGGLALILGFGTRIAAVLLAVVMLVATVAVKLPMAPNPIAPAGPMPGYELDLALLGGLIALLFYGAGSGALDSMFGGKRTSV